jgi:hypothetical protein
MNRIIEERDHFTKGMIEANNRLGRMLGATTWCEYDFHLCTKEMLEERLRRIATVRKEISDKMLEEYHNLLENRKNEEASK